jgi:TPP-dependent indolepyruvate ferredoxin oxidoreductase alpha subunit
MPIKDARTMLKPGGRIIDINPTPAKMARSLVARDFKAVIAKYTPEALETVAHAAAQGKLGLPVARAVPLTAAIDALTELELAHTPKGGKLIITLQ